MAWLDDLLDTTHQALVDLPENSEPREFLRGRGVTEAQIQQYRLGFAPADLSIGTCTAEFWKWQRKYWSNRLVFPLYSTLGHAIGLQTRSLRDKQYQQFYAYDRGIYPYLFGLPVALPEIWRTRQVVVVEGVFDCLAAGQVAPNAVATLTANIPRACRTFLWRYATRVTALLDMDETGREKAADLQRFAPPGRQVVIPVYEGHDPGDLARFGRVADLRRALRYVQDVVP